LSIAPWNVHHDPALWGSDVNDWVPERWLETDKSLHKNWIPVGSSNVTMESLVINCSQFGKAYQQCPGQNIAFFEMTKLLVTIMRDYDFELLTPIWVHWQFSRNAQNSCKYCVKRKGASFSC
jgi:cytochrome P450